MMINIPGGSEVNTTKYHLSTKIHVKSIKKIVMNMIGDSYFQIELIMEPFNSIKINRLLSKLITFKATVLDLYGKSCDM